MADKKLNEVTKVTDMAYVPVIMSDGSIGQIAKADLASVVAGLMLTQSYKGAIPSSDNLDNYNSIDQIGVYNTQGASNQPESYETWYGYLEVEIIGPIIKQTWIADGVNDYTFVRYYKKGTWFDWQRI